MSLVLGIGDIYHDSSAALTSPDNGILFAAGEERFTRVKKERRYPQSTLHHILTTYQPERVVVAMAGSGAWEFSKAYIKSQIRHLFDAEMVRKIPRRNLHPAPFGPLYILALHHFLKSKAYFERETRAILKRHGSRAIKMVRYDHHECHAYAAWMTSGYQSGYVFTYDHYGDKSFSTLWHGRGCDLELIREWDWPGINYAMLYMAATEAVGLIPGRHEGKLMGLAARGRVVKDIEQKIMAVLNHANWKVPYKYVSYALRSALKYRYEAEDIAATVQAICEREITRILEESLGNEIKGSDLALSGGLFANVKLNRVVKDLGFKNIFIHPAMADDGLAVGAAMAYLAKEVGMKPSRLPDVYLGPKYSIEDMEHALKARGLDYVRSDNPEDRVAELLAEGHVVARYAGRMEYGPRALGNRSILYSAQDDSVNDWLNKKLRRTEFMPFAPTIMAEYAPRAFDDISGCEDTARFMTITFRCKEGFKRDYSGVVHIDGTARPQILDKEFNPEYYALLRRYRELTGKYAILNTSFNMHEEPIVLTPSDAVRAFLASQLDYMLMGPFIVKKRPLTYQERIDFRT